MSAIPPKRRFEKHFASDPARVGGLAVDHEAIVEGRTIFPSTVVDPRDAPRLLVSGANQRKIGDRVTKGRWSGMPIYTLTLEERASCPTSCFHWRSCYGNGMPWSRRHKHGSALEGLLAIELANKQRQHPQGFVVRLHILGDFYSVKYAKLWLDWLKQFSALRVFGYTANSRASKIGAVIELMNWVMPNRCLIRFSVAEPSGEAREATTIFRKPKGHLVPEGLMCPAQTRDEMTCGSCALCWAADKTIVFAAHGRVGRKPANV